ncbi:DNA repair protein RadC [Paludibacter propionicigenes WB4]|uniref:DNA repair protein RadC n=1 Tax=Paludibacter propionicigenes (strain DSM 17365 / JCM 13257 / WB4) TaxID=694427 RepID=E4T6J8_PALPW|nr:DNA repair protein RadC [Paludibacter propionicigenes]ADQ80342.1 DNA repair protein RadC [Paludibacter propionicigenes WB4]
MVTDDKRLTIRDWAEDDRPREKMLCKGCQCLSDAELLAILIGSGNRDESAVELSRRIMHECSDNINELAQLSITDLCKRFKGIGEAKAITIMAALEIGKRRKTSEVVERKKITSSLDLFDLFEPQLVDLPHEEFWVGLLNGANKVIEIKRLTQGGSRQTVVDIPMLLKMALEKSALAVVVAHNHPSGQNRPSHEDEQITRKIKVGCEAIGITLLDHIIIAKGQYYSFADEGKM